MNRLFLFLVIAIISIGHVHAGHLLVEAESFSNKGGWVNDPQCMDQMGSPYLMAHGLGIPVADASTRITLPSIGSYYLFVRTYNWTSPWYKGQGSGRFQLLLNGIPIPEELGATGTQWKWQSAGKTDISSKVITLSLHDLTGFNGRCDAIYFTTEVSDIPPSNLKELQEFRKEALKSIRKQIDGGSYDFVVTGGGVAGMCAAVSAARAGMKVALIQDRPVLGGNNSSEVRVHLGGRINKDPYPALGNMIKEFGPSREGNAKPAEYYEDQKKMDWVLAEKNITLFTNYRVIDAETKENHIRSLIAKHTESGKELRFKAPLFADCTGDGSIGFLAGADFATGRENKSIYNEPSAPEKADSLTMGGSIQWYSKVEDAPSSFPIFSYGLPFNEESAEKVVMCEWTWETGMNLNQIDDYERIRDYGLMVVYSNWSFLKNRYTKSANYSNLKLDWVSYISGKRESRRLLGDIILKEQDIIDQIPYEDASFTTTWSIDLHYPDPNNSLYFPDMEFKSIAKHIQVKPYAVPYCCLYSRNISNLFMAGRDISVSHVALGTVRVMRTTGMMGEVVGMAASLCKKHKSTPREIYRNHLLELKLMMKEGAGVKGIPDNQQYN